MRPGAIGYSRWIRLPSTTPQPAAFSAGSMCSALVSASFTVWRDNSCSRPALSNDSPESAHVFAYALHFVEHAMAIGADGYEILKPGSYLPPQPRERNAVMGL